MRGRGGDWLVAIIESNSHRADVKKKGKGAVSLFGKERCKMLGSFMKSHLEPNFRLFGPHNVDSAGIGSIPVPVKELLLVPWDQWWCALFFRGAFGWP